MKKVLTIISLAFPLFVFGQGDAFLADYSGSNYSGNSTNEYVTIFDNEPISRFALTVNPLGFVQFGPIVGMEIGLKDNLALNIHSRITSLGLINYVMADDPDKLSGLSIGAGPIIFFGDKQHKPYAGLLFEYDWRTITWGSPGDRWHCIETSKAIVFITNGGYRFRFSGGFFINTGAFLGAARASWYDEYTYYPGEEDEEGVSMHPFGMLELTFGIEF